MNKNDYKKSIRKNKNRKKPLLACSKCGVDDANLIEMHHVDGRNNSDWEIPLCKNCHTKITAEQNKASPKVRSKDAPLQNQKAFNIISIGALLRDLGDGLIDIGWDGIEDE